MKAYGDSVCCDLQGIVLGTSVVILLAYTSWCVFSVRSCLLCVVMVTTGDSFCIIYHPKKHEALSQCYFNVGPAS